MGRLKAIIEAALLAAEAPLSVERLQGLFEAGEAPDREAVRGAIAELAEECEGRGIELREVAGGYRLQVRPEMAPWVSRLWEERPGRYSRAMLETLALIAYRQPITRGDIEQVRGVSVSTSIIRTLEERGWIRTVGRREVPGRPALYATTPAFLEHFNLGSLDELPELAALQDPERAYEEIDRYLGRAPESGDSDQAGGGESSESES